MPNYLNRSLEPVLQRAVTEFPAVVLTGPRQSGKTTLLKHLFGNDHAYLSLELPDVRAAAEEDPRSFLARFPPPVIYDEVQFAPGLLPYVKERIDEDRDRAGQFLLSGSQNLLLNEKVTEVAPRARGDSPPAAHVRAGGLRQCSRAAGLGVRQWNRNRAAVIAERALE